MVNRREGTATKQFNKMCCWNPVDNAECQPLTEVSRSNRLAQKLVISW